MNTKELVMGSSFISFLFVALIAVLITLPGVASAHAGEVHGTNEESINHLRETAKNLLGNRASSTVDATCMAGAVETRETALIAAWSKLNTSVTSALTDRKTALIAAWNLSSVSERGKALVAAWKEWRTDKKAANTEFRKDRKAAWDAFKKTAKETCKTTVPKEENLEKTEKDSVAI